MGHPGGRPVPSEDSRLIVNREGDVYHIGFLDRNILEEVYIQAIATEINRVLDEAENPKVVINFENVEHLSSAVLGTLITINNRIKEQNGQLRLANIDAKVYEIFLITKLNQIFHIYETTQQAVQSFK